MSDYSLRSGRGANIKSTDAKFFLSELLDKSRDAFALLDMEQNVIARSKCAEKMPEPPPGRGAEITLVCDNIGTPIGYLAMEKKNDLPVIDFLTGIVARESLQEEFAKLNRNRRPGDEDLPLVFIDLNHFKPVNETYGHLVGDQILIQFATLLKNTFRKPDIVARYGGDEFVVICKDCPAAIAEKRIKDFQERLSCQYIDVFYSDDESKEPETDRITLSFCYGIADVDPNETFEDAIRRADFRLGREKHRRAGATKTLK